VGMVAVGVVRTPSDGDPGERLLYLEDQLAQWLDRFSPDVVAVERVFADVNVASVMTTAHATAIALLVAANAAYRSPSTPRPRSRPP
jgi:crossover junction endodeoxyribonuclease RuvC